MINFFSYLSSIYIPCENIFKKRCFICMRTISLGWQ